MIVLTIVGARPQFIKAAAVSAVLSPRHREILVHTGQHYDDGMSDLFFRTLKLAEPAYRLGVGSGTHAEQTSRMLVGIEQAIERERPDVVLVYGDTNSTLAGALAAAKLNVPLAHVEAGCRSYDRTMPEEINRVITDHLSSLLFCPTRHSVANLAKEGISRGVHEVGDVMLDMLSAHRDRLDGCMAQRFGVQPRAYVVATIHRPANTDEPDRLRVILDALGQLGEPVIFPIHPRTRKAIGAGSPVGGDVRLVDPVGYLEMLALVRNARLVITDSGGVQKEAFFLETPCVTVRESTEWLETVESGWNCLVPVDRAAIVDAAMAPRPQGTPPAALYGDGRAAAKIVGLLSAEFTE